MNRLAQALESSAADLLPVLEDLYKDLHQHPELSMQEERTARVVAERLDELQAYEVTRNVGVTGVVAVLQNGNGPVVMLRADMDALPMAEATGLPYASTVVGKDEDGNQTSVAHTCGHDMHVAWLLGAARILADNRDAWSGTAMLVFQPGEEVGRGARAMMDDRMMQRFPKPDVILGQHVMVGKAGTVSCRSGVILSAGDSLKIRLFGRGSHGSQPQTSIDPVVMAAAATMRLQTIVAREVAPADSAVVTVGSLQAGTKENIIPDDATLKINIRTYDERVREHVLGAVTRICRAESLASGAPREPEVTTLSSYPLTSNDAAATERVAAAFAAQFGDKAQEARPAAASEDFSVFGRMWSVPYVFWFVGGTDGVVYDEAVARGEVNKIPSNHSPMFAPIIHPTLETGLAAMLTAASAWVCRE
jgi:hippurate hydrolase